MLTIPIRDMDLIAERAESTCTHSEGRSRENHSTGKQRVFPKRSKR